jgi:hypothetical protein
MTFDSFGKLVPGLILPHAQEWAARAGHTQLSKILVDEQLRSLLEKIGEEIESRARSNNARVKNGHGKQSERRPHDGPDVDEMERQTRDGASGNDELMQLQERLSRLETEYEWQQKVLEIIRKKVQPIAAALGSCTDCLVGVAGCPKCHGRGKVGSAKSDLAALNDAIVKPLAASGVPLSLQTCDE